MIGDALRKLFDFFMYIKCICNCNKFEDVDDLFSKHMCYIKSAK